MRSRWEPLRRATRRTRCSKSCTSGFLRPILPRDGPAGEYYRVRVGPFATEDEARQVAKVLQRQGHRIFLDEIPAHAVPPQAPNPRPEKGSVAKQHARKH